MKLIKTKKYKGSMFLRISIVCMFAFFSAMIVKQQLEIKSMEVQLEEYNVSILAQEEYNTTLQYSLQTGSLTTAEYIEEYARTELNYIKPGERVFVNIGGNTEG